MHTNVAVLAGSAREGRRFIADHNLRGARAVFDLNSALGTRFDVLIELPGFSTNRARWGVEAQIRSQGSRHDICRMLITERPSRDAVVAGAAPHQTTIEEQIAEAEREPLKVTTPASTPERTARIEERAAQADSRYQVHSRSRAAKQQRRTTKKAGS